MAHGAGMTDCRRRYGYVEVGTRKGHVDLDERRRVTVELDLPEPEGRRMKHSFAEVYADREGRAHRPDQDDGRPAGAGLHRACRRRDGRLMQVLRLHLGKACPGTPNRALRKAVPFIEPVSEGGKLRWSLTRQASPRLEELTFLQLGGEQDLVVSIRHFHQEIRAASRSSSGKGNYPEAVGRAAKQLNAKVRNMTGRLRDEVSG